MKPGRFEYFAPTDLDEALDLLTAHAPEAAVLAGGQSLVPAMNFRLANPAVVVDINRVAGLNRVQVDAGDLVVEALARHHDLEKIEIDDAVGPLLRRMSHFVGHLPIRVRGTFVGSMAHADPAAEWCVLAVALDSTIVARSSGGIRQISATDFFEGYFSTARAPDEIITEVRLPLLRHSGAGFQEASRTAGDFATVAVVATLQFEDGAVAEARIGIGGADSRPVRAVEAEDLLRGHEPAPDAFASAARAAAENVSPMSDAFCSADYRRSLVEVLTTRALAEAAGAAA